MGRSLHMHTTIKAIARFPEEVNSAEMGVPVHQVKEFSPRFQFWLLDQQSALPALAMTDHPDHLSEVDVAGNVWPRTMR